MEEGFFQRWARRKNERTEGAVTHETGSHASTPDEAVPAARVQLADVEALDMDSDYSAFVGRDVDQAVRRAAMKKMFTDPHFNTMDGLDIYISDYNKPSPMSAAMLAALKHSQGVFAPANTGPENAGLAEPEAAKTVSAGAMPPARQDQEERPEDGAEPDDTLAPQSAASSPRKS